MDIALYSLESESKEKQPSLYFDTTEKCTKWVKALNWILDPSPQGYRASMKAILKKPGQLSASKSVEFKENMPFNTPDVPPLVLSDRLNPHHPETMIPHPNPSDPKKVTTLIEDSSFVESQLENGGRIRWTEKERCLSIIQHEACCAEINDSYVPQKTLTLYTEACTPRPAGESLMIQEI